MSHGQIPELPVPMRGWSNPETISDMKKGLKHIYHAKKNVATLRIETSFASIRTICDNILSDLDELQQTLEIESMDEEDQENAT